METILYQNGQRYTENVFAKEQTFEQLIVDQATTLFGTQTLWVDTKKKLDTKALGGVIPDGFLLDLNDPENPEFYIVEVELAKHSFYGHIFPQITKFFAFFKNPESQSKLVEKLYGIFDQDKTLYQKLKGFIGKREVFKFLKDMLDNSQNILLVLDAPKPELPEIMATYTDTWDKMVKVQLLKVYRSSHSKEQILMLSPPFEALDVADLSDDVSTVAPSDQVALSYNASYHLDNASAEVQDTYKEFQSKLIDKIPDLNFNYQKRYISLRKKRNFAYLKIRKSKINLVAMLNETNIRQKIQHHPISSLSDSVQRYYNGDCARIDFHNAQHLDELVDLLVDIQK
ncbi:DUF5655 domain-containing protein [uncultured Microscilla sp.]|uniref:DUF5655 domain-containing protein n=1 Tax=uncultured Microscilla sp. TaxID=432653 RepID=UPI00261B855E|nr:DUF5655 domain-containing protein [uncultured Microscilla sp.]